MKIQVWWYFLGKCRDVVSGVTLTCDIQRVLYQVPGVVLVEIWHEVDEVICSQGSVVNEWVALVCWEADTNGLIDADEVSKMIPTPSILNWFVSAIYIFDKYRPNFIKASKLTGPSRPTLQPNNDWHSMIKPALRSSLPYRIIHGSTLIIIKPIYILIAWEWLFTHIKP